MGIAAFCPAVMAALETVVKTPDAPKELPELEMVAVPLPFSVPPLRMTLLVPPLPPLAARLAVDGDVLVRPALADTTAATAAAIAAFLLSCDRLSVAK